MVTKLTSEWSCLMRCCKDNVRWGIYRRSVTPSSMEYWPLDEDQGEMSELCLTSQLVPTSTSGTHGKQVIFIVVDDHCTEISILSIFHLRGSLIEEIRTMKANLRNKITRAGAWSSRNEGDPWVASNRITRCRLYWLTGSWRIRGHYQTLHDDRKSSNRTRCSRFVFYFQSCRGKSRTKPSSLFVEVLKFFIRMIVLGRVIVRHQRWSPLVLPHKHLIEIVQ